MIIEPANCSTLNEVLMNSIQPVICTPFITKLGLDLIGKHFKKAEQLDLMITGNISDWAKGYADLYELGKFIKDLQESSISSNLYLLSHLHAKAYGCIKNKKVYFGSANLTNPAFRSNLEIMTFVEGSDAETVFKILREWQDLSPVIGTDDFLSWIDVSKDCVNKVSRKVTSGVDYESDDDFLTAAQLFSDELLKKASKPQKSRTHTRKKISPDSEGNFQDFDSKWPKIEDFISFCQKEKSEEAEEIIKRYNGKANLQGHIKHMFYGSLFFFFEHQELIKVIEPDLHKQGRVPWNEKDWIKNWIEYLNFHRSEQYSNIGFYYDTLINYLPTSLGGVQQSGGASSGNFKKVIGLLAKMLREHYIYD